MKEKDSVILEVSLSRSSLFSFTVTRAFPSLIKGKVGRPMEGDGTMR